MRRAGVALLGLVAVALIVASVLPTSTSQQWWIRAWEYPRPHLLGIAVIVALGAALLRAWVVVALAAVAVAWQAAWLWPVSPLAPEAVVIAPAPPQVAPVRVMSLNVLMENDDHAAVRDLIARAAPDVLVLLETDATWAEALEPVLAPFPHVARRIADDHYGMIFASRLPAEDLRLTYLDDDVTPFGIAQIAFPGGPVTVTALHPRPPVPSTSAQDRDDQIARASVLARREGRPAMAIGDFNDVPWSASARRFRESGDWLDPAAGRWAPGTFDVTTWWLRLPLDQALVTTGLRLHRYGTGARVGSDHLPLLVEVTVEPGASRP